LTRDFPNGGVQSRLGENHPERVATVQRITWAYLHTGLYPHDPAWRIVRDEVDAAGDFPGSLVCE